MLVALLAPLFAAAVFDYKYKRIPDVITALGWLLLSLEAYVFSDSEPLLIAGASFAILFSLNAALAYLKEPLLSWGDILLVPVYGGYCSAVSKSGGEVLLAALLPVFFLFVYVVLTGKNKEVALAPFLFLSALVILAA